MNKMLIIIKKIADRFTKKELKEMVKKIGCDV